MLEARPARACSPPSTVSLGVPGLERAEARPRDEGHDVLRAPGPRASGSRPARRSPWRRARRRRRGRSACGSAGSPRASTPSSSIAPSSRSASSPGSTISARSRAVAADQEAVLLHRPDGEHADVHQLALRACLRLAAAVDEQVGVVAERDVEERARTRRARAPAAIVLVEQQRDEHARTTTPRDRARAERAAARSAARRSGPRGAGAPRSRTLACARRRSGLRPVRPRDLDDAGGVAAVLGAPALPSSGPWLRLDA